MADLTLKQKQLLELNYHRLAEKPCPVCGAVKTLKILDTEYRLVSYDKANGALVQGPQLQSTPIGVISCTACGYSNVFIIPNE